MLKQLLNWFRRAGLERDLDRELKYHIDRRMHDLRLAGLPEAEARRQALLELGGLAQVREEVRDAWLTRWARDFVYDLRFSVRSLLHNPSFTAAAVLSLALGIGATSAIYSLVDQVILHALPVRDPDRLVLIDWNGYTASVNAFGTSELMSYPICRDLQQQERFFDGAFCRAATTIVLSTGGEHAPAAAEIVSGSYFSVLGVQPSAGRLITNDDDGAPGASPVVVLSYDFWKARFDGAPDAVGRKVLVNRHPMTVIGVAAREFKGIDVGEVPSLWIPAAMSAQAIPGFDQMLNRRVRWMQVLARLRPDVTVADARVGLQPWFKAMLVDDTRGAEFPNITADKRQRFLASTLQLTPAPQGHSILRRRLSQPLWVLFGATAVLLGLAAMNVSGLFLARGSARARELTTRLALGASRGRIGRQLLVDSLLIALCGGLLGIALAPAVVHALTAFLPHDVAGSALRAGIDTRLLLFTFLVSLATGVLAGFAPALQAGKVSLISSLKARAGHGIGGLRLRRMVVTTQIALTLILVTGAGLFVRTLGALLAKGPGFETPSLISFGVDPVRNGYTQPESDRLMRRLHDEIRASPSTKSAALAYNPLLTGGSWNSMMTIRSDRRFATDREVRLNAVSPDFFTTLGIRIVAGRDLVERDALPASEGGQCVGIVNEAFARRYFNGGSPLGAHVALGTGPAAKHFVEVVGVVADISYRGVREEWEQVYYPQVSCGVTGGTFYVRIQGPREAAFQSIRTILHDADPTLPVPAFRTLDEQVNQSLNTERILATLSAGFGALALLLSLVGVYGVMSFAVTQRARDIAVRIALGARRGSALWFVLRDAIVMIGAGTAVALPCVYVLGRLIESQLFGITATDPGTIGGATLLVGATGLCAALVPGYRAAMLNPVDALRAD